MLHFPRSVNDALWPVCAQVRICQLLSFATLLHSHLRLSTICVEMLLIATASFWSSIHTMLLPTTWHLFLCRRREKASDTSIHTTAVVAIHCAFDFDRRFRFNSNIHSNFRTIVVGPFSRRTEGHCIYKHNRARIRFFFSCTICPLSNCTNWQLHRFWIQPKNKSASMTRRKK